MYPSREQIFYTINKIQFLYERSGIEEDNNVVSCTQGSYLMSSITNRINDN